MPDPWTCARCGAVYVVPSLARLCEQINDLVVLVQAFDRALSVRPVAALLAGEHRQTLLAMP